MRARTCYLGDGSLAGAASYLAAIMLHDGLKFDYVPSNEAPSADFAAEPYALYVVSDYPASRFGAAAMTYVADSVRQGSGLVMLGGWESFFGRAGEYHQSPLADVLPVVIQSADDRHNCAQPCLIHKAAEHPILEGLPWDRPPGIGGFNVVTAKPDAETLLTSVEFFVRQTGTRGTEVVFGNRGSQLAQSLPKTTSVPIRSEPSRFEFTRGPQRPLLVVGRHGCGRTAALATDAAPHWVGGLVDWGDRRVVQDVACECVEVGNWYARFFGNLLAWTGMLDKPREVGNDPSSFNPEPTATACDAKNQSR